MPDIPSGYLQFTAAQLRSRAAARAQYVRLLRTAIAAELSRRAAVVTAHYRGLSRWQKLFRSSAAGRLASDHRLASLQHTGFPTYVHAAALAMQLGFESSVDYEVADAWLRKLDDIADDTPVFVDADIATRLMSRKPTAFRFQDIPWAEWDLPALPPQPPVEIQIPDEERL